MFRSTLFERNILQLSFTAEKSYDVISYPNLGMISFQTMKPFIRTWDSKTTFHKKCYIFQSVVGAEKFHDLRTLLLACVCCGELTEQEGRRVGRTDRGTVKRSNARSGHSDSLTKP